MKQRIQHNLPLPAEYNADKRIMFKIFEKEIQKKGSETSLGNSRIQAATDESSRAIVAQYFGLKIDSIELWQKDRVGLSPDYSWASRTLVSGLPRQLSPWSTPEQYLLSIACAVAGYNDNNPSIILNYQDKFSSLFTSINSQRSFQYFVDVRGISMTSELINKAMRNLEETVNSILICNTSILDQLVSMLLQDTKVELDVVSTLLKDVTPCPSQSEWLCHTFGIRKIHLKTIEVPAEKVQQKMNAKTSRHKSVMSDEDVMLHILGFNIFIKTASSEQIDSYFKKMGV